jgi:threonine aldolase
MPDRILDLRSDTVTRPTPAMRAAMAAAEVGDDVFGDDPTVQRLQRRVAEMLGKEAALLVPSGTMSNLIGVRLHCKPGDEMICEAGAHVYNHEQGGYAQLNGVGIRTVEGEHGVMTVGQFEALIRPDNAHYVRTRLVCIENTHNRGGGRVQPYPVVEAVCRWARDHGLRTHLDGARLWNAAVASGIELGRWTQHFDTVNVCFSKGLGAPVGSAICGPRDLIAEALRHRKVFGGGMRQAGILAAAALYALDHHVERLAEDHANARRLAEGIRGIAGLRLDPEKVETNIVFFHVDPAWCTAAEFCADLKKQGVRMLPESRTKIRALAHLDVNSADVDAALRAMEAVIGNKK